MSRIPTPASIEASPVATQPLLSAVQKQLGVVPNMFRLIATAPAALKGYLALNGALGKGQLDVKTRERIALAVAEVNGCSYCLSAHSYLATNLAKLSDAEIAANRDGGSANPKADAAVRFAVKLVRSHGRVSDQEIETVRHAGFSDAQIIEIVTHVALNIFTNYINEVGKTDIDFPIVTARHAA